MSSDSAPIAIVGLSYRAPGVGRKGLWDFLAEAKSAWSPVPSSRFDQDAFYNPDSDKAGTFSSRGAHFLPGDVYSFDAPFFNMRPDEARAIDPQHRLLLECAFEATESAGKSLVDLVGSNTGVFAAIGSTDYIQQVAQDLPSATRWTATGFSSSMFANRLSYFFDLAGPSISMDAACASSSYAVHLACQSLRAGECESAFAGSATLLLGPSQWSFLDNMGALSPEGKCFSYDHKASGFGRGEGAACFLLKRLDDAIRDNDPVHAVILNSAANHGGQSDGITMPRRIAQEKLLRKLHEGAGLDPSETTFVEGHGTGTKVGDPIEAGAFANVLATKRTDTDPLYIGSLKSNFGHLESASGILGMVKAVMMIKNGLILPNHAFEEFNEGIQGKKRMRVASTVTPWPRGALKRVCVTNFGFGGSNAAVIINEAPWRKSISNGISNGAIANGATNGATNGTTNGHTNGHTNGYTNGATNGSATNGTNGSHSNGTANGTNGTAHEANGASAEGLSRLFVLSAKSEGSLASYLSTFANHLATRPSSEEFARDLSYTLGQRRTHFGYRYAAVAPSVEEFSTQLATARPTRTQEQLITMAFTGQGAQYAGMAAELWRYEPFARAMKQAEAQLTQMGASWSLIGELEKPAAQSIINQAEISQPASTAVQLGLVELLKSWGIFPSTVLGHSSGEIAAAYAAGFLTFREALGAAYLRGQAAAKLSQQGRTGAMLALGVSKEDASAMIQESASGYVTVAAVNSPQSVTVSGDVDAIEAVHELAKTQGVFVRRLPIAVAYHSEHMQQVADSYLAAMKEFGIGQQPVPKAAADAEGRQPIYMSSVTGKIATAETVGAPEYWVQNLVRPVLFATALESAFSASQNPAFAASRTPSAKTLNVIIEVGAHSALKSPINQTMGEIKQQEDQSQLKFSYFASLIRGSAGDAALLDLAGRLFCTGYPVQLDALEPKEKGESRVVTDLPPYEFEKSKRYFSESRLVHESLHPGQAYHPLLGWKSTATSGGEHNFRQVFDLDELPWVRDHNIAGGVVFPMTGYLSLATEAVRKVSTKEPASIQVTEFHVKRALEIEEEERIDLATQLRPAQTGTENLSTSVWSFQVSSWTNKRGWVTHSRGQIEALSDAVSLASPVLQASAAILEKANATTLKERDVVEEYTTLRNAGVNYGPSFRAMTRMREAEGYTIHDSELRNLAGAPETAGSPVTSDAPTLDGHLQGIGPLQELFGARPAQVPNHVTRFWISNSIPSAPGQKFSVVTRLLSTDFKAGSLFISVAAFAHEHGGLTPVAEWESVTFRSIAPAESGPIDTALPASFYWDTLPALDFVDREATVKRAALQPPSELEVVERRNMNLAALWYMRQALDKLTTDTKPVIQAPQIAKFLNWARRIVPQELPKIDGNISDFLAGVANSGGQGAMICAVGEKLMPILHGELQPLEIMLEGGLLTRNYEEDKANLRCSMALARYAGQISESKASLKVLEIGGGTASATLPVLQELSHGADGMPAVIDYTFTDTSPGFFENARQKLSKWSANMTFKRLDIGQDPLLQGFTAEDYDIIVASNVLHATPDMTLTMGFVRNLLKPNGKLLLVEGVAHPPLGMPYALLPGWWLTKDNYRTGQDGPYLTAETWQRLLTDVGFSGIDIEIGDYGDGDERMMSMICSTRTGLPSERRAIDTATICGPLMDDGEEAFAETVASSVGKQMTGTSASVKPFLEVDPAADQFCIFIDSLESPLASDVDSEIFDVFRTVFLSNRTVLWVIPENHSPVAAVMKGVVRTVRLENAGAELFVLENVPRNEQGAAAVASIAARLRDPELLGDEKDFVWRDGQWYVPRLRPLVPARDQFALDAGHSVRTVQNIWSSEQALEATVESTGSPDSVFFRQTGILNQELQGHDVIVKNEAIGVNFRDLLVVLGSIPWTPPGFEGVGTVIKTGPNVTDVKPGDRVMYASFEGGSFANFVKVQSWLASKIATTDKYSTEDAAGIPIAYLTALMALQNIARMGKGETVLIHAASGAVGQACIVLAKHLGAGRIFATAGSPTKRKFLTDEYGIPESDIFSSRNASFRNGVLSATNSKGVDVIVNSLSGSLLQESWTLMAECGRFVEIGKRDLLQNSHLAMRPFSQNATFSAIDLRSFATQRPEELKNCLTEVVQLLNKGIITPIRPTTVLPLSQLASGLRKLQSGQNIGKIVLSIGAEESVLTEMTPAVQQGQNGKKAGSSLLQADATYVITGGTGGIGLSLGTWMIEHGARNVVLLGRSGSSRPAVKEWLAKHSHAGANTHVEAIACDVGSRDQLSQALKAIAQLPPVRGVVHGALYLRDALFTNANYDDWHKIMTPRVQGALNLQELLPKNLDFFIALSSFYAATGNIGQSIYSGTNTFFDAFAESRNRAGLPTVSIALPVVLEVGYAVEHGVAESMKVSVGGTLTESQLHTLIRGAIVGVKSGLNYDGKAVSMQFTSGNDTTDILPWQAFHPRALEKIVRNPKTNADRNAGGNKAAGTKGLRLDNDADLLEVLIAKVSSITMIDQEDIHPDAPLANYGLDSLVSVELRNWIRRETSVELTLTAIIGAANLRALAALIMSNKK